MILLGVRNFLIILFQFDCPSSSLIERILSAMDDLMKTGTRKCGISGSMITTYQDYHTCHPSKEFFLTSSMELVFNT